MVKKAFRASGSEWHLISIDRYLGETAHEESGVGLDAQKAVAGRECFCIAILLSYDHMDVSRDGFEGKGSSSIDRERKI